MISKSLRSFLLTFLLVSGSVHSIAGESEQPHTSPSIPVSADSMDELFLEKLKKLISSGALDDDLEKRWDIIQERKHALRLAQQREKKRRAEAARMNAIRDFMPAPDTDHEPFMGKKNAAFSLIEYSDFGCPFCKRFHATANAFMDKYGKHANWIYRDMPLPIHEPYATELSVGGRCMYLLGGNDGFWTYADAAFASPQEAKKGAEFAVNHATSHGISEETFLQCMRSTEALTAVEKHVKDAGSAQFTGTPSVVLRNNLSGDFRFFPGAVSMKMLETSLHEMVSKQMAKLGSTGPETPPKPVTP